MNTVILIWIKVLKLLEYRAIYTLLFNKLDKY
jgi:hypothetical protein